MNDNAQYWLNSGAWLLVGLIVASVYWRCYIHRILVKQGRVKKEQPLALFMALLVGMTSIAGLLFAQSGRLALEDYTRCQARVTEQLRDFAKQDRETVDAVINGTLAAQSSADVIAALHAYQVRRAANEAARKGIENNCPPPPSGGNG